MARLYETRAEEIWTKRRGLTGMLSGVAAPKYDVQNLTRILQEYSVTPAPSIDGAAPADGGRLLRMDEEHVDAPKTFVVTAKEQLKAKEVCHPAGIDPDGLCCACTLFDRCASIENAESSGKQSPFPAVHRCDPVVGQLTCPALCLALLSSHSCHACFAPTLTQIAGQKGETTARCGRPGARQVLRRLISSLLNWVVKGANTTSSFPSVQDLTVSK